MRPIIPFVIVLVLGAGGTPDASKKELQKFQGKWIATKLVYSGKDLLGDGTTFQFTFKGDVLSLKASEEVEKEYLRLKFKLDPTTNPPCMDAMVAEGSQKDAVIEGIYQLKGDEVTFCARIIGQERPTKFEAPQGSGLVLAVFKREGK